jgi:hypothetical protein
MVATYSRYISASASPPNDDVLITCEAAVAVQDAVYLKAADLYAKADATAEATMPVAGFIVAKPTATTALMRPAGDLDGFVGLTPDTEYYAAKVAGQITTTVAGYVAGNVAQGVGRAKNATVLTIAVQDDDYTVL